MPAAKAHRMLTDLLGDPDLAAKDLTAAVADKRSDKRLPCMQRAIARHIAPDQDWEIVPLSFWEEYDFGFDPVSEKLQIWPKGLAVEFRFRVAFFVWKPALAKIWPAAFAHAAAPAAPRVSRTNDKRQPKGSPTQDAIRQIAAQEWPDGHAGIPIKHIIAGVSPKLRARGIPVPERDTWLRALGRRKS
jgi:hypothetical protein